MPTSRISAAILVSMLGVPAGCNLFGSGNGGGSTTTFWRQLGTLGRDWNSGYFLVEVVDIHSIPLQQRGESVDSGTYVSAKILEILGGSEFDYNDFVSKSGRVESWRVGAVVSTAIGVSDFKCPGASAPPTIGTKLIVAPKKEIGYRSGDGTRAIAGGVAYSFLCLDGPDRVLVMDVVDSFSGLDEFGTVSLNAFRHFAQVVHATDAGTTGLEPRARVFSECASLTCADGQVCFFGAECTKLEFKAPAGQVDRRRFPPWGAPLPDPHSSGSLQSGGSSTAASGVQASSAASPAASGAQSVSGASVSAAQSR